MHSLKTKIDYRFTESGEIACNCNETFEIDEEMYYDGMILDYKKLFMLYRFQYYYLYSTEKLSLSGAFDETCEYIRGNVIPALEKLLLTKVTQTEIDQLKDDFDSYNKEKFENEFTEHILN